jgi:ferredoxin-nitrate reductase
VTDRIANPWGKRTPFKQGEDWPVRVDQFLEDGISEEEVDRWVQTASILHSNGDAYDMAVKDGRIVGVRGRGVDRVNKGRLGPKDLFGWQANNSPRPPHAAARPQKRRAGRDELGRSDGRHSGAV